MTLPAEIFRGEGCVWDAYHARLLERVAVPDENGAVVLEAEQPSRHFLDPALLPADAPMTRDADASGGAALDSAIYARYDFRLERASQLDVWARVATPKGASRFMDTINGGGYAAPFVEENEKEPQGYHWVKRGTLSAPAGWSRFEVMRWYGPFPRIDKLVLLPKGSPDPTGLGPTGRTEQPQSGWVETLPLELPGVVRFLRAGGLGEGAKANLVDQATLRLKIELTRAADGRSPEVGPLSLSLEVDPAACLELRNETTRLIFDRATGGLLVAQSVETGDVVVFPGRPQPLGALEFKKPGEAAWLRVGPEGQTPITAVPGRTRGLWERKEGPFQAIPVRLESVVASEDRLQVSYLFAVEGVGRARLRYVVEPAERGLWRFAATAECLEGPADVVGVVFPIFDRVRVGASGLDDRQLRLQSFGHFAVHPGKGPIRDTRYLGGSVMPWTEVYDEKTGFYVCPEDPQAINVLFRSQAGGRTAEYFSMSATKLHNIKPGEQRTWEYRVAAHAGDWHWGADRYREWFYATFGQAQYAEWLRHFDGWLSLQAENYGRSFRFAQLGDWLTQARAIGLDWVQVWGQFSHDGGTCCSAWYMPSPLYGGDGEWRRAVQNVAARKGFVGGYFIYDRLDLLPLVTDRFLGQFGLSDYPPDARLPSPDFVQRMRLVDDPSNTVPRWPPAVGEIEEYRDKIEEHLRLYAAGERAESVQWWVNTYIDDPEWWGYLREWIVDRYLEQYGCNSAYIDVLGCGEAEESYDPRRGHNGDGGWSHGKWMIAKTVVEAARQRNSDFAATMEGLGDLPGLYCMPMCSGVYRGGRNVYRYTFPERPLLHGVSNPGSGGTAMDRYLETFLEGMRFDIVGRPTALPVYLLALTRQFTPWLYQARFRDTVGLKVSHPAVQVRRHEVETQNVRGTLLTLVNRERRKGVRVEVLRPQAGDLQAAFFVGVSGQAGQLSAEQEEQGVLGFEAPDELASIVFLPAHAAPQAAVWPMFHVKHSGPPAARVTLLNLGSSPLDCSCRIENLGFVEPFEDRRAEAAEALSFVPNAQQVKLGSFAAQSIEFPIKSLREHWWTLCVRVTVEGENGLRVERVFLTMPLVLDGSWEFRGNPTPEAWHGRQALVLPPSDSGYQHQLLDLWLEPSHRYRLQLMARRTGFDAKVAGALLMVQDPETNTVWQHKSLDRTRPNEWQKVEYEFETPPELVRSGVYLYNVISPDTAMFDDLVVEDLGPA